MTATNAVGTGPASAASNAVTPTAPTAPAAPTGVTATAGNASAQVSWTAPANGGSAITSYTVTPFIGTTAQTPTTVTGSPPATSVNVTGLTNGTAYTFTVSATNAVGTGPASAASNAVTPSDTDLRGVHDLAVDGDADDADAADGRAVELGVKFTADVSGTITGIRFYKGAGNTGTHIGNLWTASGTKLASATFTNETASGWQQVTFATPGGDHRRHRLRRVVLRPAGHYAGDGGYFAAAGVDNAPLHALKDGVSGGERRLRLRQHQRVPEQQLQLRRTTGSTSSSPGSATAPAAPANVNATAGNGSAAVSWTAPSTAAARSPSTR